MKTLSMDSCQLNKSSQLLSILWAVSLYQNLLPGISHTWVTQFCGYSGVHYIPSWKQNIIQNGWSFLWLKLSPNFKAKTYFVTEPTNGNAGTLSKSTWVSLSKKKKKKKNLKGWWRGQEGGETKEEGRGRGVGWGDVWEGGGLYVFQIHQTLSLLPWWSFATAAGLTCPGLPNVHLFSQKPMLRINSTAMYQYMHTDLDFQVSSANISMPLSLQLCCVRIVVRIHVMQK